MRLTRDQVGYVSQHIVRGLLRDEFIAADHPDLVTDAIAQVLTTDLEAEDRLNDEVREMLDKLDYPARGSSSR